LSILHQHIGKAPAEAPMVSGVPEQGAHGIGIRRRQGGLCQGLAGGQMQRAYGAFDARYSGGVHRELAQPQTQQ
jgi:hypothetical protein